MEAGERNSRNSSPGCGFPNVDPSRIEALIRWHQWNLMYCIRQTCHTWFCALLSDYGKVDSDQSRHRFRQFRVPQKMWLMCVFIDKTQMRLSHGPLTGIDISALASRWKYTFPNEVMPHGIVLQRHAVLVGSQANKSRLSPNGHPIPSNHFWTHIYTSNNKWIE